MSRYLNDLVRSPCGADLLALGLFPNQKEVTESFAAYHAVRTHLRDFALSDPTVTLVAVGDGHTPRTAATFALRSAWRCISVDPNLKETGRHGVRGRPTSRHWRTVDRLTVHAKRIEDVSIHCDGPAVIVAVHSHAQLPGAVAAVRAPRVAVVAIPCCVRQELRGQAPDIDYRDGGILSPENRVLVWRDARAEVAA